MGISMKKIAERMTACEGSGADRRLEASLPVIARLQAHLPAAFKKALQRPHDAGVQQCMNAAAAAAAQDAGAHFVYTHDLEIVLAWDTLQLWHGGDVLKMSSRLASIAALSFYRAMPEHLPALLEHAPTFEARTYNVPTREAAVEAFMWRQWLALRHATHRVALAHFPGEAIADRTEEQLKQTLFNRGFRWTDVARELRFGASGQRRRGEQRVEYVDIEIPGFDQIANGSDLLFEGAEPILRGQLSREYLKKSVA
jgi:hypothetical protein